MISIVIPVLDSPALAEVLAAIARARRDDEERGVLRRRGEDVEVVVCGRDEAGAASAALAGGEPVRYLPSERPLAPGAARNRGLAASRGEDVVFLDADAVPLPGFLSAFREARDRHGEGAILGGSVDVEAKDVWTYADNVSSFHAYAPTAPERERPFLPAICLGGSRAAFEAIGGFDESLAKAEDVDLGLRARRLGIRSVFCPSMRVAHRPGPRSLDGVLRKARETGADSARVRRRHLDVLPSGRLFARPWTLRIAAPAAAAAVTALAVCRHPSALRRPRALAAVFGAKLVWCLGAASS